MLHDLISRLPAGALVSPFTVSHPTACNSQLLRAARALSYFFSLFIYFLLLFLCPHPGGPAIALLPLTPRPQLFRPISLVFSP